MGTSFNWQIGTKPSGLGLTEVQIWRVRVNRARWGRMLLSSELKQLARFRFSSDAAREATGRGALRYLASGYLGVPKYDAALTVGKNGKPSFSGIGAEIEFNISHSGEWVLLAFARQCRIGIDVEKWQQIAMDEIAQEFFHEDEVAKYNLMPRQRQREIFFQIWTLKEAYLKALGTGFSKTSTSFRVVPTLGGWALGWCADDAEADHRWRLEAVAIEPGYGAALAIEGFFHSIRCFSLEELDSPIW